MKKADAVVIGGTTEGKQVIEALNHLKLSVAVSVATEMGKDVLKDIFGIEHTWIETGRKDGQGFIEFFTDVCPEIVVDASHPFAVEVTKNVREVCRKLNIPYARFVRKSERMNRDNYIYVRDSFEAAAFLDQTKGNLLLTTGANTVGIYAGKIKDFTHRGYIRVLNTAASLQACLQAGVVQEHIIAKNPPFSVEDNLDLIHKYHIRVLVTKDSGSTGGLDKKLKSVDLAGIKAVIIQRPVEDNSDHIFNDIPSLCQWIRDLCGKE